MERPATTFPVARLAAHDTPFYYYDTRLLDRTLCAIKAETARHANWHVHYAVKANANPDVLARISAAGLGADCVSGGEIEAAIRAGFQADQIVFAGVGKSDREINTALDRGIFCFNAESIPEIEVIEQLAAAKNTTARVCLRINPDVGAHTHANITTGLAENKFGIALEDTVPTMEHCATLPHVQCVGLHFHIGSQILQMDDFIALCNRINEIQATLSRHHLRVEHINVGGGLGISYDRPDAEPVPDFASYFRTYATHLRLAEGQHLHFELGRAVVAQCGSLIARVLYVKEGKKKKFAILDAGMTDLIRPALYQALHQINNLTSQLPAEQYDVVGPICESSDVFAKAYELPQCRRGDLVALRSAGAYGEIMASQYNCRPLPKAYTEATI